MEKKFNVITIDGVDYDLGGGSNVDIHIEDDTIVINTDGTSSGGSSGSTINKKTIDLKQHITDVSYDNGRNIFTVKNLNAIMQQYKNNNMALHFYIPTLNAEVYYNKISYYNIADNFVLFGGVFSLDDTTNELVNISALYNYNSGGGEVITISGTEELGLIVMAVIAGQLEGTIEFIVEA